MEQEMTGLMNIPPENNYFRQNVLQKTERERERRQKENEKSRRRLGFASYGRTTRRG